MIALGVQAKDKITGFKGIVTARIQYLTGCDQYCLVPPMKDGKLLDREYFDEGRLEVTGEGIAPQDLVAEKPGGPQRDCPR